MDYPPDTGMLLTRYAPLRRSPPSIATRAAPRLACVKPAASVHPEPGSNSSSYIVYPELISGSFYIDSKLLSVYSNLAILLLLFYLFRFASKRLSIQYV